MDFSDDEWDISDDQWHSLEHDAIISTQQQQQQSNSRDGLRSATVSGQRLAQGNDSRSNSVRTGRKPQLREETSNAKVSAHESNSFDSPQLDEDGVPLVVEYQAKAVLPQRLQDETAQREQWRVNRFAQRNGLQEIGGSRTRQQAIAGSGHEQQNINQQNVMSGMKRIHTVQAQSIPIQAVQNPQVQPQDSTGVNTVRPYVPGGNILELQRLRQEKEELTKSLSALQTELYTAKGEVSLVRSRNVADLQKAERDYQVLKKQVREDSAKSELAISKKDAAYTELLTNNKFLKHELDEQARKLKTLEVRAKNKPLQERSEDSRPSPKKTVQGNLHDGFDDTDLMIMSPTKSPARRTPSLRNTPTKKRKHPAASELDMPQLTLRLTQERAQPVANPTIVKPQKDHTTAQNIEFLQSVLGFCPCQQNEQLLNQLIAFSFESSPTRTLNSILLEGISELKGEDISIQVILVFGTLLQKCVRETYHKPLSVLLDTLAHILSFDPTAVDKRVIASLVKPLQDLLLINARIRWASDERNPNHAESPQPVNKEVDALRCLEVMVIISSLIVDEPDLTEFFWGSIAQELTLLLLAPMQPLSELMLTVEWFSMSIRHDSFGIIMAPEEQKRMQGYTIDKLCILLWDPPRHVVRHARDRRATKSNRLLKSEKAPEPEPPPSLLEISQFRLAVVDLLSKIVFSHSPHPHQAGLQREEHLTAMLLHPNLIARLTRLIYDEVINLYGSHPASQSLHAELVNRGTRLLHYMLVSPQALDKSYNFDLVKALKAVTGGIHRFRVALTQIHFREGIAGVGLDCGIEEETTQLAMEILEEYMTPDEAYQLLCAFGKDAIDEEADDEDMDGQAAEASVMAEIER